VGHAALNIADRGRGDVFVRQILQPQASLFSDFSDHFAHLVQSQLPHAVHLFSI
jgi:hypothetical protein